MIKLEITVVSEENVPDDMPEISFCACCASPDLGGDAFGGYGENPYDALRDLINEIEKAEVWRED